MIPNQIKDKAIDMYMHEYPTYLIEMELNITRTSLYRWLDKRGLQRKKEHKYKYNSTSKLDLINESLENVNEIKETYSFIPLNNELIKDKKHIEMTIDNLNEIKNACNEALLMISKLT